MYFKYNNTIVFLCSKRADVNFTWFSLKLQQTPVSARKWQTAIDNNEIIKLVSSIGIIEKPFYCVHTTLSVTEHEFHGKKHNTHLGALLQAGCRSRPSTGWQCHTRKSAGALTAGRNAASPRRPLESGKHKRRTKGLSAWHRTALGWEPIKTRIVYQG